MFSTTPITPTPTRSNIFAPRSESPTAISSGVVTMSAPCSRTIIVTTPQEMAVGDALRGAKMFERVGVGVIGVVENMSYFVCPHCHEHSEVFLAGGGSRLAAELGVPLLGQIPLQA